MPLTPIFLRSSSFQPSQPEAGEASESDEGDAAGSQLRQVSTLLLGGLASVLLRTVCVYGILFFVQYKLVVVAAVVGVWFAVYTKMKELDVKQKGAVAGAPLLLFLVWYSSPGGWIWWIFESLALGLVFLFAMDPPFSLPVVVGLGVGGSVFAWWFKGRFVCYGVVVLIEMVLGLILLLIIPFCESLIKESLDSALEAYAVKMRLAIVKELQGMQDGRK